MLDFGAKENLSLVFPSLSQWCWTENLSFLYKPEIAATRRKWFVTFHAVEPGENPSAAPWCATNTEESREEGVNLPKHTARLPPFPGSTPRSTVWLFQGQSGRRSFQGAPGTASSRRWLHIFLKVPVCGSPSVSSMSLPVLPGMRAPHINTEAEICPPAKPVRRLLNANPLLQIFNRRPALENEITLQLPADNVLKAFPLKRLSLLNIIHTLEAAPP